MKRPEINGWEVTTNENEVKMATLPRGTMVEIVKYIEYADKQLRIGAVVGRSEQLPQDKFCKVCNLPTNGEKCYSKRCPV
jgi:hypothetical protein